MSKYNTIILPQPRRCNFDVRRYLIKVRFHNKNLNDENYYTSIILDEHTILLSNLVVYIIYIA